MKLKLSVLACLLTLFAAVGVLARTEPNSYINRPTPTIDAFIKHVGSDKQVMDRYVRHFGMTRDEVLSYFKQLRMDTIKKDTWMLVYNTPDSGELRSRILKMRKGTKVWVDMSGEPVMKVACGNPFIRGPKRNESVSISAKIDGEPEPVLGLVETTPAPKAELYATVNSTPTPPEKVEITTPPPVIIDTKRGTNLSGLLALIPLGAVFFHGGGGKTINPNPGHVPEVPPTVPEPVTIIAMAVGVAGIAARRRTK